MKKRREFGGNPACRRAIPVFLRSVTRNLRLLANGVKKAALKSVCLIRGRCQEVRGDTVAKQEQEKRGRGEEGSRKTV